MAASAAALAMAPRPSLAGAVTAADIDASRLLFLRGEEQVFTFRNMDKVFATRPIRAGTSVYGMPRASSELDVSYRYLDDTWNTSRFMESNRVAGLIVVQKGRILLERYGLGNDETSKWTSFSVAKSITSTLVGAALHDGHIKSVNEEISRYLPSLKSSPLAKVTIRDLLRMSSGMKWNENYLDPTSDINKHIATFAARNRPGELLRHMASLPQVDPPGSVFQYKTGDSHLIAEVLAAAIGGPLSPYFSDRIWAPFGMEKDGYWLLTATDGLEWGGANISATLRDYARFGQFFLGGGVAKGRQVLPDNWLSEATNRSAPRVTDGRNPFYGYQWWGGPGDKAFHARGVFGQQIFIDPEKSLVVAIHSAWNAPSDPDRKAAAIAYLEAVQDMLA
ncbi:MAG: hypothetical protein ABS78_06865 [Phenylobacterium sp. SCN 70-31]|nr:MAG: hypothetical protein ABS78_06865 [Phenylobacterium sp. SCN 70-31]